MALFLVTTKIIYSSLIWKIIVGEGTLEDLLRGMRIFMVIQVLVARICVLIGKKKLLPIALQNNSNSFEDYFDVQPDGPVFDVEAVEFHLVFEA